MSTALSLSALLLSVAAIFAYQWVTFAPWAGLGLLYRIKRVQLLVAAVAWTCALTAYALHPSSGQGVVLLLTAALAPLSGFNNAARILVALDRPRHAAAAEAGLADRAAVLGAVIAGRPVAWSLETLAPHHLVNDQVAGAPVLAAW